MSKASKKPVSGRGKTNASKTDLKQDDLSLDIETGASEFMTTDQGLKINDDQNSLKSGERGGTLLEDFILREKITHFDHERIPERIVHARGTAAHGYFQVYKPMAQYTKAGFLNDPALRTPVFVRFSTVAGSRGSTDLARDVRGFSVKFYTEEGNYDLVGNNIPVFFIQDAIKFPDLIHAVKPEPNNEIPQAASAHDTFWDFISLMPESMHMIMWVMSDRAIPRSLRMMEGFGVHSFRLINEAGKSVFVKFHWKPLLGVHSVAWDEAQIISGKDADFHRRDLFDAIESGAFPEWEFGIQVVEEKDEHKYPFDLLDPTKLIPEELVPVQRIGKMVLNRNTDNFFAETEQVAFHPGHLVPGIDFTNDPLLQGRLFSYTDTQLSRLGSPNFHEIPINRSINTVHNNQRDGHMRQQINKDLTSYHPNSIGGGCPFQAKATEGGFTSHEERIDARKVRARSQSFFDHFSQATLFYNSQSDAEKNHLTNALRFELGKVQRVEIRQRVIGLLSQIDKGLATNVADALGLSVPKKPEQPINHSIPADGVEAKFQPKTKDQGLESSASLSMANTVKDTIKSRKIAILVTDGIDGTQVDKMKKALTAAGAVAEVIAPKLGQISTIKGVAIPVDKTLMTVSSVLYDAVYIPGGSKAIAILAQKPDAIDFISLAFKHCKAIAFETDADLLIQKTSFGEDLRAKKTLPGVVFSSGTPKDLSKDFIKAIAQHRFWEREKSPV
jgi:catalase